MIPPYLPDTPEVRDDFALYYDEIGRLDSHVGAVLEEVERQGIAGETLILFLSDNGRPFPRCKTTLYDSGIMTPMLVRWPGHVAAGSRSESLVSTVDVAPTLLALAGIAAGPTFQGKDFSATLRDPSRTTRSLVFAERNWHDYASHGRAARSDQFKYIRNDDAERTLSPPADAVRSPTFQAMRRLRDAGTLRPEQQGCFLAPRPAEELYDLRDDPNELRNLAGKPEYARVLDEMRRALASWSRETGDATPAALRPDEFDRETGLRLPDQARPQPAKKAAP